MCPVCNTASFSRTWKGVVVVNDPAASEVAKLLNITPRAVHQKLNQRRMEAGHYRGRPPTP